MASKKNIIKYLSALAVVIEILKRKESKNKKPSISVKKLKEILATKNKNEIENFISQLNDFLEDYHYNIDFYTSKNGMKLIFNVPVKFFSNLRLPLTMEDFEIIANFISNENLLRKLLKIYPIKFIDRYRIEELEEKLSEIVAFNKKAIQSELPDSLKKIVEFYYKKPASTHVELKKIIPIDTTSYQNIKYIVGIDYKFSTEDIKLYRLDRIVKFDPQKNQLKTQMKISIDYQLLESKVQEILQKIDSEAVMEIIFLYDPIVELNLSNQWNFEILDKAQTINEREWKMGRIRTIYPSSVIETFIPFARFVYILEPKEVQRNFLGYFENILKNL
ncbi:MAG: hypothetical protein RMI35_09670 [Leptospiraceae bacterium]|nr:hypothetical protein [Leptospiraceae bacterium]